MQESALRNSLRRIQDIVAEATGTPLPEESERRLEKVLMGLTGRSAEVAPGDNFSSRNVTILLADLRGFTSIASEYPSGVVLDLLNRCFVRMSEIIFRHHGTIDKFMGDSIMVLFGTAGVHDEDVRHAVLCAVEMQIAMDDLNKHHRQVGLPELYMGIGLNTGNVMAGLLGSDLYSAYTVIGDEVNLASRIESFSLRGQVLISQSTFDRCRDFAKTGEAMDVQVKGKSERVNLREVLGVPSVGKDVPRQEIRRSHRVEVKIPFSYQIIENKIVMPDKRHGMILDVGYHGLLVESDHEIPLYSEIRLDFDLPMVEYRASDIFAKIVKSKKIKDRYHSGVEFTSVNALGNNKIQLFVQLLIQGNENR